MTETRPGDPEADRDARLPLRRILEIAARERGRIALGGLFMLLARGGGLAWPLATGWMIDSTSGAEAAFTKGQSLAILVGVLLLQSVAGAVSGYLLTIAGERLIAWMRDRVFRSVVTQEIAFFDTRETGELTSRIASDATRVQGLATETLPDLAGNVVTLVGAIALLVHLSPPLTGVMLVLVPPTVIGALVYGRRIHKLSRAVQDAVADAGRTAQEAIAGIRTVRAFAGEPRAAERHGASVERSFQLARKRTIQATIFGAVTGLAGFGGLVAVLWYGAKIMAEGAITTGDLIAYMLYTGRLAVAVGVLGHLWTDLASVSGSAQRVFEILDREPPIERTGGARLERVEGSIEFEDVGFEYPTRPDVPVLRGVSFRVEPGSVVALVGPSGGGKSTIASLLLRFYEPSSGTIRLDGRDLAELDPHWLRERVGIVSQEPILFSETIEENVRYGRADATHDEVVAAARVANAHDFVTAFPEAYATQVGERGVKLSAGQKQRIAIARAVLEDPSVLVLDEATSALDTESEALVQEALERLTRARTTLVIAHRLSTVRNADRVLVLDRGRIVEQGTHDELLRAGGVYERLVRLQFAGESA